MDADFIRELDWVFGVCHRIEFEPDNGKSVRAIAFHELLIAGHFFLTWLTPSSPEIYEHCDIPRKNVNNSFTWKKDSTGVCCLPFAPAVPRSSESAEISETHLQSKKVPRRLFSLRGEGCVRRRSRAGHCWRLDDLARAIRKFRTKNLNIWR